MPQPNSDYIQSFLTGQVKAPLKPNAPVKYEPTKLDKILYPFTFTERVSASIVKSLTDESTFTENMQAWVDYSDLINEQFPEMNKYARAGLGFIAGVIADPLTWTGVGALTKAGKAASTTGELAKTAAKQAAKGERALLTFAGVPVVSGEPLFKIAEKVGLKLKDTRLITMFNRGFVSPTANPISDDILIDSNNLKSFLLEADGTGWLWKVNNIGKEFDQSLKASGVSAKNIETTHKMVLREIETPGFSNNPLIKETAEKLRAVQKDIRNTEFDVGLGGKDWKGDVEYWATITTPKGKEFLNQTSLSGVGSGRAWDTRHASMLNRKMGKLKVEGVDAPAGSIEQYNAWARSQGFEGDAFITDPFLTIQIRAQRAARAIANKHFTDEALAKVPGIETFDLGAKYADKSGRIVKTKGGNISGINAIKGALRGKSDRAAWVEKGSLNRIINSKQISPSIKAELKAVIESTEGDQVNAFLIQDILDRMSRDGDLMKNIPTITKSGVKVHVMPKELAEELGKVNTMLKEGNPAGDILKIYDQGLGVWKAYTLAVPSYHFRNDVSNKVLNWMSGVRDPGAYVDATHIQWAMNKSKGDVNKLTGSFISKIDGVDDATIVRYAQRHGVVGKGFAANELPDDVASSLLPAGNGGGKLVQGIKNNRYIKFNRQISMWVESNARLTNFIDGVRQGMKNGGNFDDVAKVAAARARKTLYDYENFTPFEQKYMKRIFPFYSWTRRNLPAQVKHLIQSPGKMGGALSFDKGRRAIESQEFGGGKGDIRGVPEWMMLQYPIRLFKGKDGVERIGTLGGFIPSADLLRMSDPFNELWAMATPFFKEPTTQLLNRDPFFRSVIEQYPGQSSKFLGVNMRNRMKHVLKNVRILSEADRIVKTLEPSSMGNLDTTEALGRFFTGFKLYPQDPVKGMAYYEYSLRTEIGKYKSAIKKLERQAASGRIDAKAYHKELKKLLNLIEELEKRPIDIPRS